MRNVARFLAFAVLALAARETRADDSPYLFGGGLIAGVGGNVLDKPGDKTVPVPGGGQIQDTTYPGFGGITGGGGLFLEGRYRGMVGLELDFINSTDTGKADITINGKQSNLVLGSSAWHLPLLVKGVLPLPVFAPFVELGPEFVFPSTATVQSSPQVLERTLDATTSAYAMLTAGVGFEFKLPLPFIDIRFPLSIRGSYNPGTSSTVRERENPVVNEQGRITSTTFDSRWKYRFFTTVGAALYF